MHALTLAMKEARLEEVGQQVIGRIGLVDHVEPFALHASAQLPCFSLLSASCRGQYMQIAFWPISRPDIATPPALPGV